MVRIGSSTRQASRSPSMDGPRICVIGAGPSGLTTLKNLLALGLTNVVCFDESDAIGGNWVLREDKPSVYEGIAHIISSRKLSEFEDFPMPPEFRDFPSHRQIRAYFEAYASHFQLAPFIRLQERVEEASRLADGTWSVRIATPHGTYAATFDYLIVCSGHHRVCQIPDYPGHFSGEVLHSSAYKRAAFFANKRVLVVGGGNSGCEIAAEIFARCIANLPQYAPGLSHCPQEAFWSSGRSIECGGPVVTAIVTATFVQNGAADQTGTLAGLRAAGATLPADGDASNAQLRDTEGIAARSRTTSRRHCAPC